MKIRKLSTPAGPFMKIMEFDIESAKEGNDIEVKAIYDALTFFEEFGFGKIYKQEGSDDYWLITRDEVTARLIIKSQLDLISEWNNLSLLPDNQLFDKLKEIGGLSYPQSPFGPCSLQFPAKAVFDNGEEEDLCIFHFSDAPPLQVYISKFLLLNEVADIKPSKLALPHELRFASTRVPELAMGMYPFTVKTKAGELITYNGFTQFASTGDIKVSDIVSQEEISPEDIKEFKNVSFEDVVYVIGKWDNRLEELFKYYLHKQG